MLFKNKRKSIRTKLLINIILTSLISNIIIFGIMFIQIRTSVINQMNDDGDDFASQLGADIAAYDFSNDVNIQDYIDKALKNVKNLSYIDVSDKKSKVIANSNRKLVGKILDNSGVISKGQKVHKMLTSQNVYEISAPLYSSDKTIKGSISIGISLANMNNSLSKVAIIMVLLFLITIVILIIISIIISNAIVRPINHIMNHIDKVAQKDLNVSFEIKTNDEIQDLAEVFNNTIVTLKNMIREVDTTASSLDQISQDVKGKITSANNASKEVAASVEDVVNGTTAQSKDLMDITNFMDKFSKSIEDVHAKVEEMSDFSKNISNDAVDGGVNINKLANSNKDITIALSDILNKVEELKFSVDNIGNITLVIKGIAEKTNLLSLNASIEAARAGEAGKGFSVVADEIKKLAETSLVSSKSIQDILKSVQEEANVLTETSKIISFKFDDQKKVVKNSIQSFNNIIQGVKDISPKMENTYQSLNKTIDMKNEAMKSIENVTAISQEVAALTEEIFNSTKEQSISIEAINHRTENLTGLSYKLKNTIEEYKI